MVLLPRPLWRASSLALHRECALLAFVRWIPVVVTDDGRSWCR